MSLTQLLGRIRKQLDDLNNDDLIKAGSHRLAAITEKVQNIKQLIGEI